MEKIELPFQTKNLKWNKFEFKMKFKIKKLKSKQFKF